MPPPGYQAVPTGSQGVHGVQVVTVLDCVRHLSAVHQRILRLERVSEPVELLEPGIGVVFAVLGVTGNLDGDDVLGDVLTPVGAEGSTEYPGADEGAPLLVLAPARQLPLGEQPLVLRGLLGTDVNDDNVQLTHDGGSLAYPCADLGRRSRWVNPCRTARGHQPTRTRSAALRGIGPGVDPSGLRPAQTCPVCVVGRVLPVIQGERGGVIAGERG